MNKYCSPWSTRSLLKCRLTVLSISRTGLTIWKIAEWRMTTPNDRSIWTVLVFLNLVRISLILFWKIVIIPCVINNISLSTAAGIELFSHICWLLLFFFQIQVSFFRTKTGCLGRDFSHKVRMIIPHIMTTKVFVTCFFRKVRERTFDIRLIIELEVIFTTETIFYNNLIFYWNLFPGNNRSLNYFVLVREKIRKLLQPDISGYAYGIMISASN